MPKSGAGVAGVAAAGLLAPGSASPVASLSGTGAAGPLQPQALTGGQLKGVGRNGVAGEVNNNQKVYNDNSRSMGNVTVNVSNGMTPDQLREWQELQA